jgi:hypothetical protein
MEWFSYLITWLHSHFSDVVSLATLTALVLALVQLYWARQQTKSLERIQGSISTRFIGKLEDYYPYVVSLIESAKDSIVIQCDYPAYGCFTCSECWSNYHDKLSKKRAEGKVQIVLTCPQQKRRIETDENKYFLEAGEANWEAWKEAGKTREQLKRFLLYKPFGKNIDSQNVEDKINSLSRNEFFEMLQEADEEMLNRCFQEEFVKQIDAVSPLDFWVIDEQTAIFAFSNYAMGKSRYGFSTTDQKLISAFQEITKFYH